MKACVLRIAPSIFQDLMQLPKEASIVDIKTDVFRHGDLLIKLIGVGETVQPGQILSEASGLISYRRDGSKSINWVFESEQNIDYSEKQDSAPAIVFFPAGSLGEEVES